MRFAGTKLAEIFGSGHSNLDMSSLSQKAAKTRSDENALVTDIEGQLEEARLGADAEVKSTKLTSAGEAALGAGRAWGQAFSDIGGAIGGGIGNIG